MSPDEISLTIIRKKLIIGTNVCYPGNFSNLEFSDHLQFECRLKEKQKITITIRL